MNFDFSFFISLFSSIIKYGRVTLALSLLAIFFGFILSIIIVLCIDTNVKVLSSLFKLHISFFRGTPLIAQLFCFYFGVIPVFKDVLIGISSFQAALIVLSLASSAYMAESLRAAIASVHKGQTEAALSIGMTYFQLMSRIVFPQAIKVALPTLFSSFINIVKDTSLVFTIGVKEMMAQAQLEGASGYRYLESYVCVLLIYWALTTVLSKIQKHLEKKMSVKVGSVQ